MKRTELSENDTYLVYQNSPAEKDFRQGTGPTGPPQESNSLPEEDQCVPAGKPRVSPDAN